MNISAEKEEIIRRIKLVHDADLIKAIKSLLDFGLRMQANDEIALKASINRGIQDSENSLVRPHEDVMDEIRKRYNL